MRLIGILVLLTCFSLDFKAQADAPEISGWSKEVKGDGAIFIPKNLAKDEFRYTLMTPEKSANADIELWLQEKVKQVLVLNGFKSPDSGMGKSQIVMDFQTYSVMVADSSGKNWTMNFMAYKRSDEQYQYGTITTPASSKALQINAAVKHFMDYARRHGWKRPIAR